MNTDQIQLAREWMDGDGNVLNVSEKYCETRDVFQARLERMMSDFLRLHVAEENVYLVSAIAGEIGNNSFDHNAGNWRDVPGVWFSYQVSKDGEIEMVLADRGRGVFETLKSVDTALKNNEEALKVAFTKKISGRAPENRGNGLKFVRRSVTGMGFFLSFFSGDAKLSLNGGMVVEKTDFFTKGCFVVLKG